MLRRRLAKNLLRDRPETKDARLLILSQRGSADQLRKLPGGQATGKVHLEESVLAVHESRRIGQIGPVPCGKGGNAETVSFDGHGRGEPGDPECSIELG